MSDLDSNSSNAGQPKTAERHAEKMAKKKAARNKIMATKTKTGGLLVVNTGKGKGKSTAAFGMICRGIGHGMRVVVVQFVKGKWETGEKKVLKMRRYSSNSLKGIFRIHWKIKNKWVSNGISLSMKINKSI